MDTLKSIYALIQNANDAIYDLMDKYPATNDLRNSEEYKILTAKIKAYEEVFKIVQRDLHSLNNTISQMADF